MSLFERREMFQGETFELTDAYRLLAETSEEAPESEPQQRKGWKAGTNPQPAAEQMLAVLELMRRERSRDK